MTMQTSTPSLFVIAPHANYHSVAIRNGAFTSVEAAETFAAANRMEIGQYNYLIFPAAPCRLCQSVVATESHSFTEARLCGNCHGASPYAIRVPSVTEFSIGGAPDTLEGRQQIVDGKRRWREQQVAAYEARFDKLVSLGQPPWNGLDNRPIYAVWAELCGGDAIQLTDEPVKVETIYDCGSRRDYTVVKGGLQFRIGSGFEGHWFRRISGWDVNGRESQWQLGGLHDGGMCENFLRWGNIDAAQSAWLDRLTTEFRKELVVKID